MLSRLALLVVLLATGCQQGTPVEAKHTPPSTIVKPTITPDAADALLSPETKVAADKAKRLKAAADFKAAADAAAAKLQAAPPAQKDGRAPPPARAGLVWHEAAGVPPCVRGGTIGLCEKALGPATRHKDEDAESVSWPSKGIEVRTGHGRIVSLWVHFEEEGFKPFMGTGDHWIDSKATVEDVLRWYGPPESAFDYPDDAGVRQTSLLYFKRGLYFDFKNGFIVQIAVIEPKVD